MRLDIVLRWLNQSERRIKVMLALRQPSTAKQLAHRVQFSLDGCSYVFWELTRYRLLRCLNPLANRSRLYWLTGLGRDSQRLLFKKAGHEPRAHAFPTVDWGLYGWICHNHRSAIIKALTFPMQPAAIKRRAVGHDGSLRMSANNVRDVMRLFLAHAVVQPVRIRRKAHPRYELTETGQKLRQLLLAAEC